ncbi:MAG: NUDIX hydrolase [Ruminococcaceae bacterium]|nr:NUDIX hydrolase [Oscillospiraceae bacterium]
MCEMFEEKMISSEFIFDGKVVHLYKDKVRLPDGNESVREYVKHIGAVAVVPITTENEVICVRQYRYAIGRMLLEIPAGKLDSKDEIPEEAARRELREETGAVSAKLTYLGKFFSSPAILDECIHIYLAEELELGDTDPDEDEFLEIVKIPIDKLADMICSGEIIDGKTQAGVLKALSIIKKRK